MLDKNNLITLAKMTARANPSASVAYSFNGENFSYNDLNETLRKELKEIAGTYQLYRQNQNLVFELLEQTIDDVLPRRVMEIYGNFAEIKTVGQGEKAVYTQRVTAASRRRAKQFITKVGLAGVYEVFKLDGKTFEVPVTAYGGAAQIGLEEFLDGKVESLADLFDIILEGLDEAVYKEIAKALAGAASQLPAANKASVAGFQEADMDRLLSIADAYGNATIYCTFEFAAEMIPSTGWISDDMKNQMWNNGYLGNYKGHNVIVLPQSYEDETNTKKVLDPSVAWIFVTGNEKPIKITFEGDTLIDEWKNHDWSREIQCYKKFGVAAIVSSDMCQYINTSLKTD